MVAVVNGTARFGGLVDGAEILPLARSHLGTGLAGAGRIVIHQKDGDNIGLLGQESTEFIEP